MRYTEIFKEAERLHKLGFAIHWLHAKSKRPIEAGWTTGPRKSWKYLADTYIPGLNVGVRLGQASPIRGGYLCVVDVDVKSTDKRHRKEALGAAKFLLEEAGLSDDLPTVLSGRGGGSRHFYCLTEKTFKTWNPAKSVEKIRVKMPSKKPSKAELKELTPAEIEDGWRISHAWEVSLYSEGRQVVLPPSIHPDSGELYAWKTELRAARDLPVLSFQPEHDGDASDDVDAGSRRQFHGSVGEANGTTERSEVATRELKDFKIEPVDLGWLPISKEVRSGIIDGTGVDDRSGFLLKASGALLSAGLTQNEVLTVLTDPDTFLGAVGYDHAKTKNRERAAAWVYKYTFKKVMKERSADGIFGKASHAPKARKLSSEEQEEQTAELEEDGDVWRSEDHGFYTKGPKGGLSPDYEALLRRYCETHPYKSVADMKSVYIFNGTHYEDTTPIEIKAFAERMFWPRPEDKIRNEFWNKILVNQVTRRRFFIDTTEGKINFKNGILDLNNGTDLLRHSPEVGFRGVLPYEYDPEADCPRFKKWISGVMVGDKELICILQEFMGYIVRGGDYKYHKALWVGGTGRNGKSTFIDVLKALIGAGNYSTLSIKSLIGDKFASSDLDGKIANFSEETSPEEIADSGPFKNLTGDGDIAAQKKFGDIYSFRNRAKLVMSYNVIPSLKDLSAGMLSRPLIVPFEKEIEEGSQDHDIKKKLFKELPGIFNFALEGWNRLEMQNQFTRSAKSVGALATIKEESCNVTQFVRHYLKFTDDLEVRRGVKDLYEVYKTKERYAYSLVAFGRRLKTIPEMRTRYKHTEFGSFYLGVKPC